MTCTVERRDWQQIGIVILLAVGLMLALAAVGVATADFGTTSTDGSVTSVSGTPQASGDDGNVWSVAQGEIQMTADVYSGPPAFEMAQADGTQIELAFNQSVNVTADIAASSESDGNESSVAELSGDDAQVTPQDELQTVVYSFEDNTELDRYSASANAMNTTLDQTEELKQIETLDDDDPRTPIDEPWDHSHDPYRATVQIVTASGGGCTGTLISEFHILTAAHCVYDQPDQEWADSVTVTPATEWGKEQITPFSEAQVRTARVYDEFVDGDPGSCDGESCPLEHDFAMLTLDRSIAAHTPVHQMQWWAYGEDEPVYDEAFIVTQGYPLTPPDSEPYPKMVHDSGPALGHYCGIVLCNEGTIHTDVMVTGGQSGSPLYHYNDEVDRYEILGVVKGAPDEGEAMGSRVTFDKSRDLFDWISEDRDGEFVEPPDDKPNYVFEDYIFTGTEGDWFDVEPTDEVVLGETEVTFEHTVRNVGTDVEGPLEIRMYTAEDSGRCDVSNRDEYLGKEEFAPPVPYETTTVTTATTLPPEVDTGEVHLCLRVTADGDEFLEHFDHRFSETTTITTVEPPEFDVKITDTEVHNGLVLTDYEVENIGDVTGEREIVVEYDGTQQCAETFTLDSGDAADGACDYEVESGNSPDLDVTVISPDGHEDGQTVEIDPADFDITAFDVSVSNGEIEIGYTVENTGDEPDTQGIDLSIDGSTENTDTESLSAGDSHSDTFTYELAEGDDPSVDAEVSTDDDTESETVGVDVNFAVDITGTSVDDGMASVDYEVENTGDVPDTQDIEFTVEGTSEDLHSNVNLEAGDAHIDSFSYDIQSTDPSQLDVTVSSDDETASETVVLDGADFDVTIDSTNEPIIEGETLEVDVTVINVGDTPDTQTIQLEDFDGNTVDTMDLELGPDEEQTLQEPLTWDTETGDADENDIAVSSETSTATETVTITSDVDDPSFQVEIVETNSPVMEGDGLEVTLELENTGDSSESQMIELDVETLGSDSTSVSLDGGESTVETLSVATSEGDAGEYTVEVTSEETGDNALVEVVAIDAETNLISGDISDTYLDPIEDADEVTFTITYIGGSGDETADEVLVDNVRVAEFDADLSDRSDVDDAVGDADFVDRGEGETDEYFIELPNFGDGTQFEITADLDGFTGFDGMTETLAPGETSTQHIRLEEVLNEINITGDVVTEDNEAVPDAEVVLSDLDTGESIAVTTTDSEGTYVFTAIESDLRLEVIATAADADGETLDGSRVLDDGEPVTASIVGADIVVTDVDEAYAAPSPGDTSFEWIEGVTFESVEHQSGNQNGYADLSEEYVASVEPGETYTLTVEAYSDGFEQHVSAWFDFEGSMKFADSERVNVGSCSGEPTCEVSTDVLVPEDAAVDGQFRFRVIQQFNETPTDPYKEEFDADEWYGEAEDYGLSPVGDTGTLLKNTTRSVPEDAAPGETIEVTVGTQVHTDLQFVVVAEDFAPAIEDAGVSSVTVDGEATFPAAQTADGDGVDVVLDEDGDVVAEEGDEISVTYEMELPEAEDEYEISGDVTGTDMDEEQDSVDLGTDTVVAAEASIDEYREEPGEEGVDLEGLRQGIDDFTDGEVELELFRQIIDEFTG